MLWSGTRMPTVFLFVLNTRGTSAPARRMNVNGPGRAFFMSLNVGVSTRAYSAMWLRS